MANATNIDYTTYFTVKVLLKNHGEPDYIQLKNFCNPLKANASQVTRKLGGGSHGHLGLILTPEEYALVSPTPYICPVHPGLQSIQDHSLYLQLQLYMQQMP